MMRGTFANIRIRNEIVPNTEGGITHCFVNGKDMSIYEAAMEYAAKEIPLIVIAGKEYGTGSSRDWAAKGTRLLGVRAVIAESFERIHRSNLIGMGVLPFEFINGENRKSLELDGSEKLTILDVDKIIPSKIIQCTISSETKNYNISLKCRIDTLKELDYYKAGGILQYVLNSNIDKNS
jgi:aconitate hydratase